MKLYWWSNIEFNSDYMGGDVVVMANSIHEALYIVKKEIGVGDEAYQELKNKDPEVFNEPVGLSFGGSA